MDKLSIAKWLVRFIQSMYENARSRVRVGCNQSEEFSMKLGVHQALVWAPNCSSQFWKLYPKSFIQYVPGKTWTCMQMTWSSSLNRRGNCKSSWSFGRPTWKEKDFGLTWAKPRSWFLGRGSMCFRSLEKTPVVCVSTASAQIPFSMVIIPVGCTRNAVVSLALWSPMPAWDV